MAILQDLLRLIKRPTPADVDEGPKSLTALKPDQQWSAILGYDVNPDDLDSTDYRDMVRRDPIVRASMDLRIRARIAKGWSIEPGEGPRAQQIADENQAALESIEGTIPDLIRDMQDAEVIGHAVIEKVPLFVESGEYAGHVHYRKFAARWGEEFDYQLDEHGRLVVLYQNRSQGDRERRFTVDGGPTPDGKAAHGMISDFILYSVNGSRGNPYGESDLRPVYLAYIAKDHIQRMLNFYIERLAGGAILYKIPRQFWDRDKAAAETAVTDHRGSPGMVFPDDHEVTLAYPQGGGQTQYIDAINRYNAEILSGLGIPQTILSGTGDSGSGGSLALSETHMETFQLGQDQRGRSMEDTIDEQVLLPMTVWNSPNVQADELSHFKFAEAREDDQEVQAKIYEIAHRFVDLSRTQVQSVLGLDEPADEDDTIEPNKAGGGGEVPPQLEPFQAAEKPDRFADAMATATEFEKKLNLAAMEDGIEAIVEAGVGMGADQAAKLVEAVQVTVKEVVEDGE
jgi:phage gp29-like protein